MGDNDWDKSLKDLLGDYKPDGLKSDWHQFSNQLDLPETNEPENDPPFDHNLKETFISYIAPEAVEGWQRIQASLDAADKQFDEDIRKRIADFEPHYDPRTWPLFLQRLADSRFLGAKLIALKVIEVAAVLLILLTVVNMGRMGKLPFETPLYTNNADDLKSNSTSEAIVENIGTQLSNKQTKESLSKSESGESSTQNQVSSQKSHLQKNSKSNASHSVMTHSTVASGTKALNEATFRKTSEQNQNSITDFLGPIASFNAITESQAKSNIIPVISKSTNSKNVKEEHTSSKTNDDHLVASSSVSLDPYLGKMSFLSTLTSPVVSNDDSKYPHPQYVKQHKRTYTEFGILVQADNNRLRMPEDRLYTTGRQIIFPQQGIRSTGYGGGFTIGAAHPRWAVESGLIYSAKTFEPDRKIAIGTAFDNGIVEFEAMRLQLVTIPLQLRFKFNRNSPLKLYALAGFDLNMIVESDIDVSIKYHFPSLSAGENPNNNPSLANTIAETRRVSEKIRDGAPFSTKSFLSASAGLGLEYSITGNKTFFLQTALQYQIPDIEFSNNNGKYIRSVSIQAGLRTPFGK